MSARTTVRSLLVRAFACSQSIPFGCGSVVYFSRERPEDRLCRELQQSAAGQLREQSLFEMERRICLETGFSEIEKPIDPKLPLGFAEYECSG